MQKVVGIDSDWEIVGVVRVLQCLVKSRPQMDASSAWHESDT